MVYKLLALQDLIRGNALRPGDKLPLILTVVFYNGDQRWRAATSFPEILQEVPGLPGDLDFWSYKLVDAQHQSLEELLGKDSPLVGLFRLEQLEDPGELSEVTRELHQLLDPTEDQELAEAFVTLINETVLGKLAPEGGEQVRIRDLEEVEAVLSQRIERITHGWKMEGWELGRQEGLQKGRQEGLQKGLQKGQKDEATRLFQDLFKTKFGRVPSWVKEQAASASKSRIEAWAKRLLTAETPEDVFDDSSSPPKTPSQA